MWFKKECGPGRGHGSPSLVGAGVAGDESTVVVVHLWEDNLQQLQQVLVTLSAREGGREGGGRGEWRGRRGGGEGGREGERGGGREGGEGGVRGGREGSSRLIP